MTIIKASRIVLRKLLFQPAFSLFALTPTFFVQSLTNLSQYVALPLFSHTINSLTSSRNMAFLMDGQTEPYL